MQVLDVQSAGSRVIVTVRDGEHHFFKVGPTIEAAVAEAKKDVAHANSLGVVLRYLG